MTEVSGFLQNYGVILNEEELKMIYCVKNVEEAINIIDEAKKEFNKNKKDFCLNYEKYRIIK